MSPSEVSGVDTREVARRLFVERMPEHFERLDWDAATLRAFQTARLRDLLAAAIEGSPFHARRLSGVDPSTFELEQLASLPVMTKPEMMANYDEVTTDRRISLAAATAHLAKLGAEPELFLNEYIVLTSGGSSGVRGTFALRCEEFAEFCSAVMRPGLRQIAAMMGWPLPVLLPFLLVSAPTAIHATRAMDIFVNGTVGSTRFAPATLPFDEVVAEVERARPVIMAGYPSTIARLADMQAGGRLNVQPRQVICTSEQLTPEYAARISRGFGMLPSNSFASSEGLVGSAPPGSEVFSFASDLAIIEFVDELDRPVGVGEPAHHVLVTNLFNRTQPLIRYRLDDRMTALEAAEGSAHQRASLTGRTDEYLDLDGFVVHPLTIRSALLHHPGVTEYQVTSRARTVGVDLVTSGPVDLAAVERDLSEALLAAGAEGVQIGCRAVEQVARDPATGKVRRFVTGDPSA